MGLIEAYVAPLGVLFFSLAMICTRGHYSVDIVLAWWAFALVWLADPPGPVWVP